MGRKRKGAISRLKNLGIHATKKQRIEESFIEHEDTVYEEFKMSQAPIHEDSGSDSSFCPVSPGSISSTSSSSSCSIQSIEKEDEIHEDSKLLSFIAKMKDNMLRYSRSLLDKSRPSRYKLGKPPARTLRDRKSRVEKQTAALRAAGFPTLTTFFKSKSGTMDLHAATLEIVELGSPASQQPEEEERGRGEERE
ncbi:hypothetical protein M422DRAFT_48614 [Sphaerobolus stellatus SS14]|uniref:Uncharacterized protein n=1 Tax=Sphaerobolus stellatus (strain SS14) TaxID=990650 RepID=A0A0C9UF01_SPHS4|nr:hypothetical protein M422DRAFT_48614 [Sphaerobolus stellatus SS14]